jgi:carbon-monoxide dehydrogenase small subunit
VIAETERVVSVDVNGVGRRDLVAARTTLADYLREQCRLTGTHLGCEHGVCGACTVLLDGDPVRACLVLAVQCDRRSVTTVEGLTPPEGLSRIQQALAAHHGLQCGFCTPGFVVTVHALLDGDPRPADDEILDTLAGHLCRCTGYQGIVAAVRALATDGRGP